MIPLHPTQRRHLYDGLQHLDRQLAAIEAIVASASGGAGLFPRYRDDLSADARAQILARVAHLRQQLRLTLAQQQLPIEPAPLSALQAIEAQWKLAEISTEELGSRSMRGYGELEPASAEALDRLVGQLVAAFNPLPPGEAARSATPLAEAAPAPPELADAAPEAIEAMAIALAQAVEADRPNDELPLLAGDVLAQFAQRSLAATGAQPPFPAFDIDSIRWRLDRPALSALGRDYLLKRFRRQLEPLRPQIASALRSYLLRYSR